MLKFTLANLSNLKGYTPPLRKISSEINMIYLYFRPFVWFIFINEFIFDFYILEGESMLPTFEPFGNIVLLNKLTTNKYYMKLFGLKKKEYRKGEIVCVVNPTNHEMKICKRVIHLEGEEVELKNGNTITIPKNHVWVEGDNKANSMDSRKLGPIPKQMIIGRVPLQIWPKIRLL